MHNLGGGQKGISEYNRTANGVLIDISMKPSSPKPLILISPNEWQELLEALKKSPKRNLNLSKLEENLKETFQKQKHGGSWSDYAAAVAAILYHEGSVSLQNAAKVHLTIAEN